LKLSQYLYVSIVFVSVFSGASAQSQEVKVGDLVITQPWVRAAPKGTELTSSYVTIENKGTAADRLVGGSTEVAEKLQIQKTSKMGGATTAEPLEGGLGFAPGEKVALLPGSFKLALLKLKSKLTKGTVVPITLEFEKAGKINVPFDVLGAASTGPAPPKVNAGGDDAKKKK
jgi:copper(I)-binding protein